MVNKSQFQIASGQKMIDYAEEPINETIPDLNLKMAVSWKGRNSDIIGAGYGILQLAQFDYFHDYENDTSNYYPTRSFNVHECSEEEFPKKNQERPIVNHKLYCFDDEDLMRLAFNNNYDNNQTFFKIFAIKNCSDGIQSDS